MLKDARERNLDQGYREVAQQAAYVWILPSEKYFRARTNGSSALFFLLSFSATLWLLLLLWLDKLSSFKDDCSESEGSDRLAFVAMSSLLELKDWAVVLLSSFKQNSNSPRDRLVCTCAVCSIRPVAPRELESLFSTTRSHWLFSREGRRCLNVKYIILK